MLQDPRLTSPVFWGGAFERVVGDGAGASHPALLGYEKRGVSMARSVSMERPRGDVTVYLMVGLLLLLLVLIVVMLLILKDEYSKGGVLAGSLWLNIVHGSYLRLSVRCVAI